MVSAGVGGVGLRIGEGVARNDEGVELAEHTDGRAGLATGEDALDSGQGEAVFEWNAHLRELLRHES